MNEILFQIGLYGVVLLAGRTVLSLMPPGEPGSQSTGLLPVTWAVAFMLGVGVFMVPVVAFMEITGYDVAFDGWRKDWMVLGAQFAFWGTAAAVRWKLLPGAMVPRHAPRESRTAPWAMGMYGITWVLIAIDLVQWVGTGEESQMLIALIWIGPLLHALRTMRVHPAARAGLALAFAVAIHLEGIPKDISISTAFYAAILMGGVGWTRRADQRGRAVVACFLAVGLFMGFLSHVVALGVATSMIVASLRGSAKRTAALMGIALIVGQGLWEITGEPDGIGRNIQMAGIKLLPTLILIPAALAYRRLHASGVTGWREIAFVTGIPLFSAAFVGLARLGLPIHGGLSHVHGVFIPAAFLLTAYALLPHDRAGETA